MPTIETASGVVTHINVFTVPREKQQLLVDALIETVREVRSVPGWISASIHRSFDGNQVVNYVQFESHEAAQAVLKHLAATRYLKATRSWGRWHRGSPK